MNLDLLEHAVLNQIESDIQSQDFESFSEMMQLLLQNKENQDILFNYLGDSAQENLKVGITFNRY